jgi:hypothetical protein
MEIKNRLSPGYGPESMSGSKSAPDPGRNRPKFKHDIHSTKPYTFIEFRWAFISQIPLARDLWGERPPAALPDQPRPKHPKNIDRVLGRRASNLLNS